MSPTIAVLALQGAFIEHEQRLQSLGCTTIELRQAADLARPFDGLVLPGGESTVQAKLLHDLGMFEPLRQRIAEGLPALGTCAGLILLADHFRTLPVTVRRNAYGRQLGSFHAEGRWEEGAKGTEEAAGATCAAGASPYATTRPPPPPAPFPPPFFRPPRIEAPAPGAAPLAPLNAAPVAVPPRTQTPPPSPPNLDADNRLYEALLAPLKRAY